MQSCKISIITVNYNNLEGLQKTVKSVESQTWQEFEYIVIDGGSSDGSGVYLEQNANLFDYWVSEPDKGVYHAMNKGIAKATGEYLLFLNSGDHFFENNILEKNHQEIRGEDIIYFNLQVVEGAKVYIKEYPVRLSFSYFVKDTLPHPATFINREAFDKSKMYNEDFKILSDWKFFIDGICKYNMSYKKIESTLSTFYIGGLSSNPLNRNIKYQEKQMVLQQDYAAFIQDLEEVLIHKETVNNFRNSRIIKILVKMGFLNKF
jgi:glycosyltransferase involved in cell wall biosynthesis